MEEVDIVEVVGALVVLLGSGILLFAIGAFAL